MEFTKLMPNVFYENIQDGLELFVECLGFEFGFQDLNATIPCCVVESGSLAFFLFENTEYALKDRPEFRLHTNDIESVYNEIAASHPHLLHPNLDKITKRPWGALEFALKDRSNICVIIQQWN